MAIEKFFNTIRDGEWHSLNDLAELLEVSIAKVTECTRFLSEQGIVSHQESTQCIRIEPDWKNRLPEEALTEEPIEN